MRDYVPDNLDAFTEWDADQERKRRLLRRQAAELTWEDEESDIPADDLPDDNEGCLYGYGYISKGRLWPDG